MVEFPCPPIRSAREIFVRRLATVACASVASVASVALVRSSSSSGRSSATACSWTADRSSGAMHIMPLSSSMARQLAAAALAASSSLLALLGLGSGGPRWSLWYNLWGINEPRMIVRGTVQPGYEPVLEAFQANLAQGQDDAVQFAAYIRGEKVVDLAGCVVSSADSHSHSHSRPGSNASANDDRLRGYAEDSYTCCWSSSKVLESAVIAWLVDREYISYDTRIKDVWPEFTGGGKERLTLADLMKHEAGLKEVPSTAPLPMEAMLPENIKDGHVSKHIEEWECKFPKEPKSKQEYHALTRGLIGNEVVRRVDPKGRTIGEILRQEFIEPLGIEKECYAGVPKELSDPSTNGKLFYNTPPPKFIWLLFHKLSCLVGIDSSRWDSSLLFSIFIHYVPLRWTRWKEFVNPKQESLLDLAATPLWCQGEMLSGNVCTSARGLAAIANVLSQRDPAYFKGAGLEKAMANPKPKVDATDMVFNDGGWGHFASTDTGQFTYNKVGIKDAIGWNGWNGSCMIFHPEGDFAIALNPVAFGDLMPTPTSRLGRLISSLTKCASASNGGSNIS